MGSILIKEHWHQIVLRSEHYISCGHNRLHSFCLWGQLFLGLSNQLFMLCSRLSHLLNVF